MATSQEPYRRQCQKEALATVKARYTDQDETNLSMCTGAGKTFVIVDVCHLPGVTRSILIFPSLLLIQQFYRDHKGSFANMFYFATEGTLKSGAHAICRISASFAELAFDTFTILTTYVSAPILLAALSESKRINLLVADEAHHITAPVYSAAYARAAPFIGHTVHFSATLPDAKEPHYKYPLLKGIRDGIVRDFNIELFLCKSGEETGLLQMIDKLVALHEGKAKILIYTAEANTDGSSVRTFMTRYAASVKARGWWIEGINADTPDKDRDPILRAFEADKSSASILVSCRTLSEGIDLKNANCMLPWDPSASVKDNIQRIGRVVRLYKTTVGAVAKEQPPSTILIPVFVEEADYAACSGDRAAIHALLEKQIGEGEKGNFRPIVNVCTALKSELAEEDSDLFNQLLNCAKKQNEADGSVKSIKKRTSVSASTATLKRVAHRLRASFSEGCQILLGLESVVLDTTEELILARLTTEVKYNESWEKRRLEWIAIYQKLGVRPCSSSKDPMEQRAANWQNTQRQNYKKKRYLTPEQISTLEETDGWEWESSDRWEPNRLQWLSLYTTLGRNPSQTSENESERWAGIWQNIQRMNYRKKAACMTLERITILESTEGWQWEVIDQWEPNRLNWITQYNKLGSKPVAISINADEKRAGIWQSRQRQMYKNGLISVDRIAILEAMEGWEWEAADPWEPNRLNWITQFKKFGKIPSHASINADEKRAGQWQSKQRNDYKQKKEGMTPERIAILEATEGWQWEYEDQWEPNHINWITQYNKLGSKPIATSAHADEKRAGIWQSRQRVLYKENSPLISADRIALLEATKGWTWGIDDEWETHRLEWIYQLKKLGKAPSDTDKNADEKRAGQWQGKQRQDYKKKEARMTAARIAALESIDGWEWEVKDTWESSRLAWAALYQKLGKNPSGGASDINEKQAHKWQTHQRDDYKKKEPCMTAERIKALEATVGWKWAEEDPWDSNRLLWIAFYQTVGRTPSGMSKNTEEKFLGQWQQFQRQLYKKKDHRMKADRIKILEATEGWSWTGSRSLPKVTECDVIEHVNDEDEVEGLERKRHIPTGEGTGAPQDRTRSQLELLHKDYKTRNADTYFSLMQTDPAKFEEYHAVADLHDARDPPERKPQHRVAEMLKKNNRASYRAIDLGCGRNALRTDERVSKMSWTSVDVVAADSTVTVADMGALPFEDESFDIAVLNRSLWARNHDTVLREVYRILKEGGRAILCESFQRWYLPEKKENELLTAVKAAGFTVISEEGTTSDSSVSVFQYIEVRRG